MTLRERMRAARARVNAPLERVSRPFRTTWPSLPDALLGMFALALVLFALATQWTALGTRVSELLSGNKYVALVNGLLNPFRNHRALLDSGLPVYDLKIRRQEYAKVEAAVGQALARGYMSDDMKVWAKARFIHEGKSYPVKVRVRGDLPPHWEGAKKSWRVKFGKEKVDDYMGPREERIPFEGREEINLVIPSDREYVLGNFLNSLLGDQGLVTLRDRFVVLRINGVVQGLYYEIEHFDNPALAAQRRPETTIFGQNDRAMHFEQYTRLGAAGVEDARFDIGSMRLLVDREGELAKRAMQVLIDHSLDPTPDNFRRAREVLDWEKYLRFRVLTTLLNTNHVRFGSDNLRLYFDQSRGLFEPVPWDAHLVRLPDEPGTVDYWNSHGPDALQVATLTDPELRRERNRKLWELVADGGDALMARFDEIHHRIRPVAWADVLTTPIQGHKMDLLRSDLVYNVKRVHKVLSLSLANLDYRHQARDRAELDFAALNFCGVVLEQVELADPMFTGEYRLYEDADRDGALDPEDPLVARAEAQDGTIRLPIGKGVLPGLVYDADFIDGRYWEYYDTRAGRARFFLVGHLVSGKPDLAANLDAPLLWKAPRIQVVASNAVTGQRMGSALLDQQEPVPENHVAITAYDASDPFDLDATLLSRDEFLRRHPEFAASGPRAVELPGRVTLAETVIVPRGVPLVLGPGADVTLAPGVSVLAYGGLRAEGTPESRVRIHGDASGDPWGVLAVQRPPEEVVVRYVDIEGASQAQLNATLFTGGFAVHEGDLRIEHSTVTRMQSEDGVNLKNGRIFMDDVRITGNASDAMDLDFVEGEVRNSVFAGNRGDGLDLSGARVAIVGNRFEDMGDKGISVGEDSHPLIVNNLIRGCTIGVSAKDLSFPRVAHTTFVGNGLAIEAKRKKPMFGAGGGEFVGSVFAGNAKLVAEDHYSTGRIRFRSSLFDPGPAPECPGCIAGDVRFVGPESGDFRLAAAAEIAVERVEWEGPLVGAEDARTPGILTALGQGGEAHDAR